MKRLLALLFISIALVSCGSKNDNETVTDKTPATEAEKTMTTAEQMKADMQKQQEDVAKQIEDSMKGIHEDNILKDSAVLAKAQEDLQNLPEFKGKDVNFFQDIRFYGDGRIMVAMQSPENPDNIDDYTWKNGTWGEPVPVQISGGGDISANVTPLKNMKFTDANKIFNTWMEKAKEVEGFEGELDYVFFNLMVSSQKRRWVASTIEGTRAKYQANFDENGELVSFEKQ